MFECLKYICIAAVNGFHRVIAKQMCNVFVLTSFIFIFTFISFFFISSSSFVVCHIFLIDVRVWLMSFRYNCIMCIWCAVEHVYALENNLNVVGNAKETRQIKWKKRRTCIWQIRKRNEENHLHTKIRCKYTYYVYCRSWALFCFVLTEIIFCQFIAE